MTGEEFVIFRQFTDKKFADELIEILQKNGVEYRFEDNTSSLDGTFGATPFTNEYLIKLQKIDFEKAEAILVEEAIDDIDSIDADYYLLSFTDSELREVVAHNDEWSKFDYLLAQKLLKERGQEIDEDTLEQLRHRRLDELAKPERIDSLTLLVGYVFVAVGGLLGVLIGWYIYANKKTLPNGVRIHTYTEKSRSYGKWMMIIGLTIIITSLLYYFIVLVPLN